ncbi:MAG: FIST N-terminal domain-containing protein [Campylobacterota bacterium]|nr:FIST N-terminal domain-containing protein [Campylobacterota bacterium]
MKHLFTSNNGIESFKISLESIYDKSKTLLILSCANTYTKTQLDPILQQYDNTIIGAIFPEIIYQGKIHAQGCIFILLDDLMNLRIVNNLDNTQTINLALQDVRTTEIKSIFVFADALSKKIDTLTYSLFENFGLFFNYCGAGAGNMNAHVKNQHCIISNQGLNKECAIVGFSRLKSSLGIAHGWSPISPLLKVTKAKNNVIEKINYENAYSEYKKNLLSINTKLSTNFSFNTVAKNYPIGIQKLHNNISIIRDPILTDEKDIICIGDVEENSLIHIMKGENQDLLNATKEASMQAYEECDFDSELTFYFAGISRLYLLEEKIQDDISMIQDDKQYIMGALCLGEIANIRDTLLEFHNRTTVICKVQTND